MLEYSREFMVLASRLNYTAAAAELNVSQPSLSRHMALLEKEVGFKLLERNPVALTPAGRYYLEVISDIVGRLDAAVERGRVISREGGNTVSISMVPSDCPYSDIIYGAIARLREERVDFVPRFLSDKTRTVFEAVASGLADVGVLLDLPDQLPDELACEWLVDSPFDAWLHEESPVLNHQPVLFEDLADCRLVCSTNQQFRTWLDGMSTAFRQHGMEPKLRLKDLEDMTSFMLELQPDELLLGSDTGAGSGYNTHLVRIRFNDPTLVYSAYLLYRCNPVRPLVERFVRTCHELADS
ncbi:LysR family transcriptional regulator [Eggerthella sp. YY7918]|uniref:LysR family transcriptional regulator n=1 Tax=Eggerthella sp. (strain YY7918) TaxID=502558 RepID=UPI0002D2CFE0|nr:LysR family transcriptional regulator [Eggerthella sp. YY7918]